MHPNGHAHQAPLGSLVNQVKNPFMTTQEHAQLKQQLVVIADPNQLKQLCRLESEADSQVQSAQFMSRNIDEKENSLIRHDSAASQDRRQMKSQSRNERDSAAKQSRSVDSQKQRRKDKRKKKEADSQARESRMSQRTSAQASALNS